MTVVSTTRRLVTKKGRVFVTDLEVDELLDFWRIKYDAIFANEARNRRVWGANTKIGKVAKAPGETEAEIAERQIEWDEYVREQLADLVTAK
jgi:hypothetical protein